MSYYAKSLDGKVIDVISADPGFFDNFVDTSPGTWLLTSYNTRGNIHYGPDGQPDGGIALRGNYAGIGDTYDHVHDVFYTKQPFSTWVLNQATWLWEPPFPPPNDGQNYIWDGTTNNWVLLPSV